MYPGVRPTFSLYCPRGLLCHPRPEACPPLSLWLKQATHWLRVEENLGRKAWALSRVLTPGPSTFSALGHLTLVWRANLDFHPQGALGRAGRGSSSQGQPLCSHLNPTPVLSTAAGFTMGWWCCSAQNSWSSNTPPHHCPHSDKERK